MRKYTPNSTTVSLFTGAVCIQCKQWCLLEDLSALNKCPSCSNLRTRSGRFVPSWTNEDDDMIRTHFQTHTQAQIALIIGRTVNAVRNRASVLKCSPRSYWTSQDLERMREVYLMNNNRPSLHFLVQLASELGRPKSEICSKAKVMGLTCKKRKYGRKPIIRKFNTHEERNAFGSARQKQYLAQHGHPKGMLGLKHSDETKRNIGIISRRRAAALSPEERQERARKGVMTRIRLYGSGGPNLKASNTYSRARRGKRADLDNVFFRSRWEANYARYLRFLKNQGQIQDWEYEPKTFIFHGVTRGALTYLPDFCVTENDGTKVWHEVKGWMDDKSKAKLKRMAEFYPDEKLIIIDAEQYKSIRQYSRLIEGWEDE